MRGWVVLSRDGEPHAHEDAGPAERERHDAVARQRADDELVRHAHQRGGDKRNLPGEN